jgi:hypothetical protein
MGTMTASSVQAAALEPERFGTLSPHAAMDKPVSKMVVRTAQ